MRRGASWFVTVGAMLSTVILCVPAWGTTTPYWGASNLSGFTAAAGTTLETQGFDAVPVGTDMEGQGLSGTRFESIITPPPPPGTPPNPLLVVDGNSTFTSSSGYTNVTNRATNRLFPTTAANVISPGGLELPPGPDSRQEDSMRLTFEPPIKAVGFDILFQSWDNSNNTNVQVTSTDGVETFAAPNNGPTGSPPGRAVFAGFISTSPVSNVEIVESDDNSNHPDSNIGLDTLRVPSTAHARPKGATPTYMSLVPAYERCAPGSENRVHGPPHFPKDAPDPNGSCNPPTRSSWLDVGTPDANGAAANAIGSVVYRTRFNAGPPDDLLIDVSINDVRCVTHTIVGCDSPNTVGTDYAGELQETAVVRITDKASGVSGQDPATVEDIPFAATVPCSASASVSIGSTCSVSTSANAVQAGAVVGGKRAIWALDQVQVLDGGPDGDADTPSENRLFMAQGVFVP